MINRLMLMLTELLDKKLLSAAYLANLMDVSTRTVHRYVDILSNSSVPVYCVQGRNGGICIGEEYKLNSTIFARSEMEFLRDMSSCIDSVTDSARYTNLISKIGSVNAHQPHNITSSSLYIQPNPNSDSQLNTKISSLEQSINDLYEVTITYVGRNDNTSRRTIRPLNFVLNNNEWYLYAYCTKQNDMRIFKLSRITNITTLTQKFQSITGYPKKWKFEWNEGKELINIVLRVEPISKYDVEEWLGIQCVSTLSDGIHIAYASRYFDDELVYKILSFGTGVAIVEPKILQDKLLDIINTISRR